jgi:ubiquinone/menaquinone biosynthesis C-methylase UbiE
MDATESKQRIATTFNRVAENYDCHPLRFFDIAAQHLIDDLTLYGHEQVLDIACGTGKATLALAEKLPAGHVHGIDISEQMLNQAKKKADARGLKNLSWHCTDIDEYQAPQEGVDAITSGFGLFFLPDIQGSTNKLVETLKPGGQFAFTTFTEGAFSPLSDLAFATFNQYGIETPQAKLRQLDSVESHYLLLSTAGLENITTLIEQCGYYLKGFDEWWGVMNNAGFRGLIDQLSPEQLPKFKQQHQQQIEQLMTDEGIWMDVGVLVTSGTRS